MKRLLLIALCSVACVTTAQEGEQMRADIAALRADLKKEMDATSGDRQKDQQRAKALQDALDQLSRAARKSGADLAVDLEKAQNDLSSLRGQIEVLQHRLDAVEKTSQEHQKALDAATQFVAQRQKGPTTTRPSATARIRAASGSRARACPRPSRSASPGHGAGTFPAHAPGTPARNRPGSG